MLTNLQSIRPFTFHDIWHFMKFDVWHFMTFNISWHLTLHDICHFMTFDTSGQRHSVDRALWALWALLVLHDLSVLRDLPALCWRLWSLVLSAPSLWKVVLWRGFSYFSDEKVGQYEWQSWAFGNLKADNNFADVTLACEDGQQLESHKVILAEQVLF